MKSKIKFSDLPILLKTDRRFQIAAIVIFLLIVWPIINPSKPRRVNQVVKEVETTGTGKTPENEIGQDLVTAFKQDLDSVNERVTNIETSVDQQGKNLKDFEERTAQIFNKVLERINEREAPVQAGNLVPQDLPPGEPPPSDKLEKFGETEDVLPPPLPPAPQKVAIIGAGDSVRVQLLAGVNAPTDGTPYPVVFKLTSDVLGPDGSSLPLGEARLIAAAQGSLTDARALFRLTSMNIRLSNGRRKVVPVDGWIVGEDGIRGMAGVLIDPIGKAIAGAGLSGAVQGIGQGIAQSQTQTTNNGFGQQNTFVTGDTLTYGAGLGISSAANAWSGIIQDRLEQMVPVVQVLSGRDSTAVFSQSVTIPDLYEALESDENNFQFASMD